MPVILVWERGKHWDSVANQHNLIAESQDLVRDLDLKKHCALTRVQHGENTSEPIGQEQTFYEL